MTNSVPRNERQRNPFGLAQLIRIGGVLLLLVVSPNRVGAKDVLWLKGQQEPIVGTLVERADNGIMFESKGADSATSYQAGSVENLIVTIETERMANLSTNRLAEYRDYAEELAAYKIDPDAQRLAIRLLLIAALHGEQTGESWLVESSLATLVPLGRTPEETRKFSILQVLYSKNSGQDRYAGQASSNEADSQRDSQEMRRQLLELVRLVRKERFEEAKAILQSPVVTEGLMDWAKFISDSELASMVGSNRLSSLQLKKLLTFEIALQNPALIEADESGGWHEQSLERTDAWASVPTLGNVTEFDPTQSVYLNGRWQKPRP